MIPQWIETGEDFTEYILGAHFESVNASSIGLGGNSVHVGVFDSVHIPPADIGYNINIKENRKCVETNKDYTHWHGYRVSKLISHFAPSVTISFYQTVTEEEKIPVTAFADAIDKAIRDDVDIVNISSGEPWGGPIRTSPHSKQVKRLLDEGITVVAAAGNDSDEDSDLPVHCPAAVEDVIAVGGYVTKCPVSLSRDFSEPKTGPYFELSNSARKSSAGSPRHLYCGQQDCAKEGSCFKHQTEVPWKGNPNRTGDKPDVFAPVHYPYYTKAGEFDINCGTSFAAPIVTGVLAEAYSELKHTSFQIPKPFEAKKVVRDTATVFGEEKTRKLNGFKLKKQLKSISSGKKVA